MITQWPLVIASACLVWAAGLFASLCAATLAGEAPRARMGAWATTVALLVAGCVGFVMRTSKWDRLFNTFAHFSSPITQELICIALVLLAAIVFLVARSRGEGDVPRAVSVAGVLAALLLAASVGRSLIVPATASVPSQVMAVLAALGGACALGPTTMAAIASLADRGDALRVTGRLAVAGSAVGAAVTVGFLAFLQASRAAAVATAGSRVQYGVDPTRPQAGLASSAPALPFSGDCLVLSVVTIVAAVAALAFALAGRRRGAWRACAPAAAVCAAVALCCLLVVYFVTGSASLGTSSF
ncbi:MAG: hypothetical protein SOI24_10875 [Coriobacteriales bacterium]|jgi:hypothetical protein